MSEPSSPLGEQQPQHVIAAGDVVRLHSLKILQMAHEAELVFVQEHIAAKGLWSVILPNGDKIEVAPSSMKPLDPQDMFQPGDFVRLHSLPILSMSNEGEIATVQGYVEDKDAWKVQLQSSTKGIAMLELFSNTMKKVDDAEHFFVGELLRIVSGESVNEVVTVRGYDAMTDRWKVTLLSGKDLELYSEVTVRVNPNAFDVGDLVVVDGNSNVVIQQYLDRKDKWKVITNDGSSFEIFPEEANRFTDAGVGNALDNLAGGSSKGGFLSGLFSGSSAGTARPVEKQSSSGSSGFLKGLKGGLWGGSKKSSTDTSARTFEVGEQVHLSKVSWKEDGTVGYVKEIVTGGVKTRYKVILNNGEVIDTSASHMKDPIEAGRFKEGQMVRIVGEGPGTITKILLEKGMLTVRCNGKHEKTVFLDKLELGEGHGAGPSSPISPTLSTPTTVATPVAATPVAPPAVSADAVLDELVQKLAEAGTTIEEVSQYTDEEVDELLKDELKVSVIKRVRMKQLIKDKREIASPPASPVETTTTNTTEAAPVATESTEQPEGEGKKHADPLSFLN